MGRSECSTGAIPEQKMTVKYRGLFCLVSVCLVKWHSINKLIQTEQQAFGECHNLLDETSKIAFLLIFVNNRK